MTRHLQKVSGRFWIRQAKERALCRLFKEAYRPLILILLLIHTYLPHIYMSRCGLIEADDNETTHLPRFAPKLSSFSYKKNKIILIDSDKGSTTPWIKCYLSAKHVHTSPSITANEANGQIFSPSWMLTGFTIESLLFSQYFGYALDFIKPLIQLKREWNYELNMKSIGN